MSEGLFSLVRYLLPSKNANGFLIVNKTNYFVGIRKKKIP